MRQTKTCECCGHRITMYRHNLNKQLVDGLVQLALYVQKHGKGANLQKDLELTVNQYNNFQKLQYFDLVRRIHSGWMVTRKGLAFIKGECGVFKTVATFGKDMVSDDDPVWYNGNEYKREIVYVWEILGTEWKTREEYQKEKGCQFSLFFNMEYA